MKNYIETIEVIRYNYIIIILISYRMNDIPIFSGENPNLDSKTDIYNSYISCGQFLAIVEDYAAKECLKDDQIKIFCQTKLSSNALNFFEENSLNSWVEIKRQMLKQFSIKLSIKDKVEVRKKLQQHESESVDDFYHRCVQAQFLGMY